LFEQRDFRKGEPPRGPLENLTLTTPPRSTEMPGLCRMDSAVVDFAPIRTGEDGPDTLVRPVGLTSYPLYRFLRPPTLGYFRTIEAKPTPNTAACTSPDIAKLHFFTAEEDRIATDATLAFIKLRQAVANRRRIPIDCHWPHFQGALNCQQAVERLPEKVYGVDICDTEKSEELCWVVNVPNALARIVTSNDSRGGPGEVLRVKLVALTSAVDAD
jgi:hypothetical protein